MYGAYSRIGKLAGFAFRLSTALWQHRQREKMHDTQLICELREKKKCQSPLGIGLRFRGCFC